MDGRGPLAATALAKLRRLDDGVQVSLGRALSEQAAAIPDATFFLWRGRAFSYAQANARVDAVVRGLWHCGVRPGDRVGVMMANRPSYLSAVAALSRLGAVACLIDVGFGTNSSTRRSRPPHRGLWSPTLRAPRNSSGVRPVRCSFSAAREPERAPSLPG